MENVSEIVKRLGKAGFGFENVNIRTDSKEALLRISIDTKPDILNNTMTEYEEKYNELLSILEDLGIQEEEIGRVNLNIYPVYYGQTMFGIYEGYTQIIVKTDRDNIELISDIIRNNTSNAYIDNVKISISDKAIEEARKTLTREAIDNAWKRASEVVEPLGFKVKEIKNIEIVNIHDAYDNMFYKGVWISDPYSYGNGNISLSITVELFIEKI